MFSSIVNEVSQRYLDLYFTRSLRVGTRDEFKDELVAKRNRKLKLRAWRCFEREFEFSFGGRADYGRDSR